jgi:hypothetical protein
MEPVEPFRMMFKTVQHLLCRRSPGCRAWGRGVEMEIARFVNSTSSSCRLELITVFVINQSGYGSMFPEIRRRHVSEGV